MADLTITPANVVATNANTAKSYGVAASAISAGQVVWLDTSVNQLKLAQATSQAQASAAVGIALDSALGAGQPIAYATAGDVTLGNVLTSGSVYVLGALAPGNITSSANTLASTYITVIGVATSPTNLRLAISPVAALR